MEGPSGAVVTLAKGVGKQKAKRAPVSAKPTKKTGAKGKTWQVHRQELIFKGHAAFVPTPHEKQRAAAEKLLSTVFLSYSYKSADAAKEVLAYLVRLLQPDACLDATEKKYLHEHRALQKFQSSIASSATGRTTSHNFPKKSVALANQLLIYFIGVLVLDDDTLVVDDAEKGAVVSMVEDVISDDDSSDDDAEDGEQHTSDLPGFTISNKSFFSYYWQHYSELYSQENCRPFDPATEKCQAATVLLERLFTRLPARGGRKQKITEYFADLLQGKSIDTSPQTFSMGKVGLGFFPPNIFSSEPSSKAKVKHIAEADLPLTKRIFMYFILKVSAVDKKQQNTLSKQGAGSELPRQAYELLEEAKIAHDTLLGGKNMQRVQKVYDALCDAEEEYSAAPASDNDDDDSEYDESWPKTVAEDIKKHVCKPHYALYLCIDEVTEKLKTFIREYPCHEKAAEMLKLLLVLNKIYLTPHQRDLLHKKEKAIAKS